MFSCFVRFVTKQDLYTPCVWGHQPPTYLQQCYHIITSLKRRQTGWGTWAVTWMTVWTLPQVRQNSLEGETKAKLLPRLSVMNIMTLMRTQFFLCNKGLLTTLQVGSLSVLHPDTWFNLVKLLACLPTVWSAVTSCYEVAAQISAINLVSTMLSYLIEVM